jgi:hypothetical protein
LRIAIFALNIGIGSGLRLPHGRLWAVAGHCGVGDLGYWATICVGRIVLGLVAERVGAARILTCAIARVIVGMAMMALAGSVAVALAGMATLGLATAPMFPLLTQTTAVGPTLFALALIIGTVYSVPVRRLAHRQSPQLT